MAQYVKHKRSSAVVNGAPKLPTPANIGVGEIAINFADGYETLSILNSSSGIATFSSDEILDGKYAASGNVKSLVSELSGAVESNEFVIAQAFNDQNDRIASLEDAGFITGYTETDPTVPAWAKASSKPTYTASEVGAVSTATTYFDDAEYDSNTKRINFKKNNTVVDYIDATDFIKDGMVSSVTVSNGNLVISFNTEAGREDIELALTQIFNPNNYYDKTAADAKFLSAYTETDPTVVSFAKKANGFYEIGVHAGWPVDPEIEDTYGDKAFPTWHRVTYELNKYALSAHTHSNYSLTSHTHSAADIGAMATSERGNYLPTGTTLDNVADGTSRKLSNYALSSHTHSDYSLTSHTHSEYLTTATTIPNDSNLLHKTGQETVGPYANKLFDDSIIRFSGVTDDAGVILYGDSFIRKDEARNRPFEYIGAYDGNGDFINLQDALDTKITSADTKVKMYTVTGVTNSVTGRAIASALPQDFYTSVQSDVANGVLPVVKLSYTDGSSVLLPLQINPITQGELLFTAVYYNQTYTFTFNNHRLAYCDYKSYWLQDSNTLYADIKRSGFTQSAITAITINGAAASVSNGVASANLPVLPTVTSSDNGKVLTVVNGQWSATTPLTVYTGNNAPDNSMGNNGDIYLQTS